MGNRPSHLGKRAEKSVEVDLTGAYDPATGMRYARKRFLFPEIFRLRFDPDEVAKSPPLPVGVESVAKEVFGEMYGKKVKLSLHPWFKRWCLFEKLEATKTLPAGWACFQVFSKRGTQQEGYLPADLAFDDHRADDLRGRVGDYTPPDRQSLEWVSGKCDTHKNTADEILATVQLQEKDAKRDRESEHESMLHDFHSYYFNYFRDTANIEEGCASRSMQCNQTSLDVLDQKEREAKKVYVIVRHGVRHRVTVGSRHEEMVLKEIADEEAAKVSAQESAIEHSYKVEEDLDRRALMKSAKHIYSGASQVAPSGKQM